MTDDDEILSSATECRARLLAAVQGKDIETAKQLIKFVHEALLQVDPGDFISVNPHFS
jgi:hypothetical protein